MELGDLMPWWPLAATELAACEVFNLPPLFRVHVDDFTVQAEDHVNLMSNRSRGNGMSHAKGLDGCYSAIQRETALGRTGG